MNNYIMYLDDIRDPKTDRPWVVVRSVYDALSYFADNGCPIEISFDHDLGDNVPSGFDLAKSLVEIDINCTGTFIPKDFKFNVHSANPVGAANISGILDNYLKFKQNQ